MDLIVENGIAMWGAARFRCAVGKNGVIAAADKREGDHKTPAGRWPMRQVFYRPDRLSQPITKLPVRAIDPNDGWCEIPNDPHYNELVKLPYVAVADKLWRDDHLYDVLVVLGYNDSPVKAGAGSAIFLHLVRPDFSGSAGCVTLPLQAFLKVLGEADPQSCVDVRLTS